MLETDKGGDVCLSSSDGGESRAGRGRGKGMRLEGPGTWSSSEVMASSKAGCDSYPLEASLSEGEGEEA